MRRRTRRDETRSDRIGSFASPNRPSVVKPIVKVCDSNRRAIECAGRYTRTRSMSGTTEQRQAVLPLFASQRYFWDIMIALILLVLLRHVNAVTRARSACEEAIYLTSILSSYQYCVTLRSAIYIFFLFFLPFTYIYVSCRNDQKPCHECHAHITRFLHSDSCVKRSTRSFHKYSRIFSSRYRHFVLP